LVEHLEYPFLVFARNSDPGIGNNELPRAVGKAMSFDPHLPSRGELDCVAHEIAQNDCQFCRIGIQNGIPPDLADQSRFGRAGKAIELAREFFHELSQVEARALDRDPPRLDPAHVQSVFDKA
jgi:hypothetical protein